MLQFEWNGFVGKYHLMILDATISSSYQQNYASSHGGWIDVLNLPPILWTKKIFKYIEDDVVALFVQLVK